MKFKLLIILLITLNSYSQNNILTDTILKEGIYKIFEQIEENSPFPYSVQIKDKIEKDKTRAEKNKHTFYKLDISKEESRKIGQIIGFCDGNNIYVNPFPLEHSGGIFFKVDSLNTISHFYATEIVVFNNIYKVVPIEAVVDFKENRIIELTNNRLKKIISENKELLKTFKKDKNKSLSYKQYLSDYLDGV